MRRAMVCLCGVGGVLGVMLGGCGVGYDRLVMVTQTNVGVNAETTPVPTVEISISRSEAVIAPTYANGDTPPVLAGFSMKTKPLLDLFGPSIGSAFTVGDASLVVADLAGQPTSDDVCDEKGVVAAKYDSTVVAPIATEDLGKCWWDEMGRVRPVFFSTDTATGVKVSWTGTGGQYPDRLSVGYKRKEWALAPLTRRVALKDDGTARTAPAGYEMHEIKSPSLIATVAVDVDAADSEETFSQVQFFATGRAATLLARQQEVRRSVFERIDPEAAQKLFEDVSVEATVIQDWLILGEESRNSLVAWLGKERPGADVDTFLRSPAAEFRELRKRAIDELGIVAAPAEVYPAEIVAYTNLYNAAALDADMQRLETIVACFAGHYSREWDAYELTEIDSSRVSELGDNGLSIVAQMNKALTDLDINECGDITFEP